MSSAAANTFEDFELVPDDDFVIDPDQELLEAFQESSPEDAVETSEPQRIPLGRDWAWDWANGGFLRFGSGPAQTNGLATLKNWILKAMAIDRGAHPIYDDSIGMDGPFGNLGYIDSDERHAEYERKVKEALLEHDRIMAVDKFEFEREASTGDLFVSFVVLTDFDEQIQLDTQVAITP